MLQLRKEVPVGFFDGLKRDTKQTQTVAAETVPQNQNNTAHLAEESSFLEPDTDAI